MLPLDTEMIWSLLVGAMVDKSLENADDRNLLLIDM
jgi:hypothetical protein